MILNMKEGNINIIYDQKWNVHISVQLKNVFSEHQDRLLLWYMYKKMTMGVTKKRSLQILK